MRTLVPGYPAVLGALEEAQELLTFPGLFGTARLLAGKAHGLNLLVLDAPYLYGRPGNPYTAPDGTDWPDNAYRFGALAKVAAEIGLGLLPAFEPDVVHMHDWQAALTAAYMHYSGKARARHGHDRAQPRLPGPVSGGAGDAAGPAARRLSPGTASSISAKSAS